MKIFLIGTCACLFFLAWACPVSGNGTGELHIGLVLTTGEHSKDSSSQTTTITVSRDAIVWEQTFGGRRRRTPPRMKKFGLSSAERESLIKLISSKNLLVTDAIELPRDGSNFRYFEISVDIALDGTKGAIKISGPSTAVKVNEEKLYQNTLTLIKELYRIVNSRDKGVIFEELIHEPIKR